MKDLPPEALAGGAVLFHEHMSLAADFMPKWIALARSMPMQDAELMTAEMRAAASSGVACIVDQGHPDMGRDWDFLKTDLQPVRLADRGRLRLLYAALLSAWDCHLE